MVGNPISKFRTLVNGSDARFVIENRYTFLVSFILPPSIETIWNKSKAENVLSYIVKEARFPDLVMGKNAEEIVTPRGRWVYPDNGTVIGSENDVTITFFDTQYSPVDTLFLAWLETVANCYSLPADHKAKINIDYYDNSRELPEPYRLLTYQLDGVYPKFIKTPEAQYENREIKIRDIVFSVDRVTRDICSLESINTMRDFRQHTTVVLNKELSDSHDELQLQYLDEMKKTREANKKKYEIVSEAPIEVPQVDNKNLFEKLRDGVNDARTSIQSKIDTFKDKAWEMESKVRGIKNDITRPIEDVKLLTDQAKNGLSHMANVNKSVLNIPKGITKDIAAINDKNVGIGDSIKDVTSFKFKDSFKR